LKKSSEKSATYQVVLAESAKADASRIYDWVVEQAPLRGPQWFEELIESLYSLEELPFLASRSAIQSTQLSICAPPMLLNGAQTGHTDLAMLQQRR
jgi:hypothetical protein